MFVQDTRVLSGWSLTVGVWPAEPLTVQRADPYAVAFPGRLPPSPGALVLLVRRQPYQPRRPEPASAGGGRVRAAGGPGARGTYSPSELAGLR